MQISIFLAVIVGLIQSALASASAGANVDPKVVETQTVEFCELLRKAKDYKDREVRVRAPY